MAKKSFNVRGTLKKKAEEPKLSKKVPLRKTSKDMSEIKERVDQMHAPTGDTKAETTSPTVVAKTAAPTPVPTPEPAPTLPTTQLPSTQPPTSSTPKPVSPPPSTLKAATKPAKPQKLVRVTIDTPQDVHIALKIKAIREGITLRQYILRLIDQDLN